MGNVLDFLRFFSVQSLGCPAMYDHSLMSGFDQPHWWLRFTLIHVVTRCYWFNGAYIYIDILYIYMLIFTWSIFVYGSYPSIMPQWYIINSIIPYGMVALQAAKAKGDGSLDPAEGHGNLHNVGKTMSWTICQIIIGGIMEHPQTGALYWFMMLFPPQ